MRMHTFIWHSKSEPRKYHWVWPLHVCASAIKPAHQSAGVQQKSGHGFGLAAALQQGL